MRLASFANGAGVAFGIVEGTDVLDISQHPDLMGASGLAAAILRRGPDGLAALSSNATRHSLSDVQLLPPVTDAERILCVGLNFSDHAAEAKLPKPDKPAFFIRFRSSFVGHGADIVAPEASSEFDFEGEIALVIGRGGYRIPVAHATDHVLGVTILADNSARDFQRHSRQVTAGKNFPMSGAIGPWLVTLDEPIDLGNLRIITRVNDVPAQNGTTRDLIFSAADIVSYASSFTPLSPGDLIALGTPAGVGMAHNPPLWLKPGDRLEIEVPGIGTLANQVVAESNNSVGDGA